MKAFKDLVEQGLLQRVPATLYGNALFVAMINEEKEDLMILVVANLAFNWSVYLCFLAQGTMLYYLWNSLGSIDSSSSGLCTTDIEFQLALIGSFLAFMYQPACDIAFEIFVLLYAKHCYENPTTSQAEIEILPVNFRTRPAKVFFGLFHVAMESAIFIILIVVGTKYILSSNGASNLIQSALSIVFIAEIDDQVAKMTLPKASYEQRAPWILKHYATKTDSDGRNVPDDDTAENVNFLVLLRPVLLGATVIAIVLGTKYSYC